MKRLSELTPEEKRIIVAEWLGDPTWDSDDMFDLNAIVKACERLDDFQKALFECRLVEMTSDFRFNETPVAQMHYCDALSAIHATASQRTDALILTIGKATL